MRAGIIGEGPSDLAVIKNILKGALGMSSSEIEPLLPNDQYDETALHTMRQAQHSNWTLVKQACIEGQLHEDFYAQSEENQFVIVHIDTDMRKEIGFEVHLPNAIADEGTYLELLGNVQDRLGEWLGHNAGRTTYAIAVEETDAWILTLYSDAQETGLLVNPKAKLDRYLNDTLSKKERNAMFGSKEKAVEYDEKSKPFRKAKTLKDCMKRNRSLAHFCNQLERFRPIEG